jgi:quercetin dioxygenase-like cupin family protein
VQLAKLSDFKGGWFAGSFTPALLSTGAFEVAVKHYKAGDREPWHLHKIATEITVVVEGTVEMNGAIHEAGTIIQILPGEGTDFRAITDVVTTVVKTPSIPGDKYSHA